MEYFWTLHADGGGISAPLCCQTTGPILDPKVVFNNPEDKLSEHFENVFYKDLMTSKVRSKVNFVNACHCWLRRKKQPYHIVSRPMKWHESYLKYQLLSIFLSFFCDLMSSQGHQRSRNAKIIFTMIC